MRINPLFISLFLFFLLILDIIHSSLISTSLNEQLAKFQKNGFELTKLTEKSSLLRDSKSFSLRIKKIDQILKQYFDLDSKDPLIISLSKFEETSFKVELFHYKYIFSNEIHIRLALDDLPVEFTADSTFLSNIVQFFKENSKLLKIDFNLWSKEFAIKIDHLDHKLQADNSISYHLKLKKFVINGLMIANDRFHFFEKTEDFSLTTKYKDKNISRISSQNTSIALQRSPEFWQTNIAIDVIELFLQLHTPTTITLKQLQATQNQSTEDLLSFYSTFKLQDALFKSKSYDYQMKGLEYDVTLDNLDKDILDQMSSLINSSNTNPIAFVFEDLEKRLAELLDEEASIDIDTLKFDELILNKTNYQGLGLELFAKSNPYSEPYNADFELLLEVSTEIFDYFKEEVVNADLMNNFIKDSDEENLKFYLKLTDKGLILNDHLLTEALFDYEALADENLSEQNTTDEDALLDHETIN
ncbi:MAG: hypothetical protein OEW60_04255 [Thiovulaceae bacterium]|nr:hypothetical protein [Sulfurimonadaceae bacterium]